jgi:hypothetical protein
MKVAAGLTAHPSKAVKNFLIYKLNFYLKKMINFIFVYKKNIYVRKFHQYWQSLQKGGSHAIF